MKRKIFTTFLLLSLFNISHSFADSTCNDCKIKDSPPEVLTNFIDTMETIKRNVQAELRKSGKSETTTKTKMQKTIIKWFNTIFNWNEYFSELDYYTTFPLWQDVPYEIKRDFELLKKEEDKLQQTFETIAKRWYKDIIITDPCKWLEEIKCEGINWKEASYILTQLLTNTKEVKSYFIASIRWRSEKNTKSIILVKESFFGDMENYYDSSTAETCSRCEWNSTQKIEKSINSITELNKQGRKWIQTWVDAWNMLIWNQEKSKQRETERILLLKELARQWVSTENTSIIMGNLEAYNDNGFFSINNNFLSNTFSNMGRKIYEQLDDFNETVLQVYNKKTTSQNQNWTTNTDITIQNMAEVNEEIDRSSQLEKEIETIYLSELAFAQLQDDSDEKVYARFSKLHIELIQTIKRLDEIIPISQKVCNDQGNWMGKCN